ncbi:hypothetical protein LCGC14_0080570 [marine sediment metagenome]|uniref:Lipocalin-like domain-containing protein n=1 Tax=marine sediment metagenome TaxID=412755 RepID=A0A0F9VI09_9ZZZZ|nr:hypothetical protein [Maribacter sp.]HDZ04996.1 hypothetical protein [Maribacter sp.]HEA80528.1 hypothetical protein [Maribacter sp.]
MKKSVFLFIIFVFAGLSCNSQQTEISELDIYGCWVLEKIDKRSSTTIVIYKRCDDVAYKDVRFGSKISLLAFNESEHEATNAYACFTTITKKGIWEYDKDTRIASLYSGHEMLKELKENNPDLYASWGSPEKLNKIKFKVISIENHQIKAEIIPTQRSEKRTENSLK